MTALDEIRGRWQAATPGPWKANDDGTIDGPEYAEVIYRGPVSCMSYCYGGTSVIEGDNLKPDAEFIAHAPTDVARLLAAVEAMTALHKEGGHEGATYCEHCAGPYGEEVPYPCPTVQVITTALGGSL